jgi:multidrug efflux system membrane fusion protein
MSRKTIGLGVAAALALTCTAAVTTRGMWRAESAVLPAAPAAVLVEVATATRKMLPVRIESLGTVTPIASVAIKARLETVITHVHFEDGAQVKRGDLLFTLDSRQIDAEMRKVEALLAGARAQLQQAERDVVRYAELIAKNATTVVTHNNAQTQVIVLRAVVEQNEAALENLKFQLDHTRIRSPISGRISAAQATVGNFVRPSDTAPLASIVQIAPIYVTFTVPQQHVADVRQAMTAGTATIDVTVPGASKSASGKVTMVDHTVDAATGMMTVRATMANADSALWPGMLVSVRLTLRNEDAVVVASVAVNASQTGTYVFVVKDGRAQVRPVKVARTIGDDSVIAEGLEDGESVVTAGQLLLTNGSRVTPRA